MYNGNSFETCFTALPHFDKRTNSENDSIHALYYLYSVKGGILCGQILVVNLRGQGRYTIIRSPGHAMDRVG